MNISDWIISRLEEKIAFSKDTVQGRAARATAADALRAVKRRFQQSGLAKKAGDAAKLAKEYSEKTYKHKPKPKPENSSTDLRTQLAYVLADKLEELSQETMDNAARKRTAQLRDPNFKGETVPIYKAGTGGTANPEQIGTRNKPGKGAILIKLQGREETPGKPAKKGIYKGKITPGATGKEARAKAAKREESINLKDLMVDILFETTFTGTSRDYVARALSRKGTGNSMLHRSKLGKALASVINAQPKVVKAKAEKKAADDAQYAANRKKGGGNLSSRLSATHWANNWPSGSWGAS